jgi:hypothetical protein
MAQLKMCHTPRNAFKLVPAYAFLALVNPPMATSWTVHGQSRHSHTAPGFLVVIRFQLRDELSEFISRIHPESLRPSGGAEPQNNGLPASHLPCHTERITMTAIHHPSEPNSLAGPPPPAALNRRQFLKFTSAGLAVSALTIVPRQVLGGPGNVPPSEKITLAGIGMGGQGAENMIALQKLAEIQVVAVCDVNREGRWLPILVLVRRQ